MINNFKNKLFKFDFVKFLIVGALSTIIDWGSFFLIAIILGLHYQISLVIAYTFGGITNYVLNKFFTFKNYSKQIALQLVTFFTLAFTSLLISMVIMFFLVEVFILHEMISRILTTFIVFIINYFMHKFITFNKNIFK